MSLNKLHFSQLEIWADVQVWRQAATQVFFALGLGFGSVIAYSSYNPRNNNCHRDAFTVSGVNFMTSVLATLVVFAVLGFRAKTIATECVKRSVCKLQKNYFGLFDLKTYFNKLCCKIANMHHLICVLLLQSVKMVTYRLTMVKLF